MALHRDLTGADLHEPKGITSSGAGGVYIADGSGSGNWGLIKVTQIDALGVPVLSQFGDRITVANVNETKTNYFVIARAGTLFEFRAVLNGTATVDTTVKIRKNSSAPLATFLISATTPPGVVYSAQPSPPVSFAIGDVLSIETNGSGTAIAPLNSALLFAYQY